MGKDYPDFRILLTEILEACCEACMLVLSSKAAPLISTCLAFSWALPTKAEAASFRAATEVPTVTDRAKAPSRWQSLFTWKADLKANQDNSARLSDQVSLVDIINVRRLGVRCLKSLLKHCRDATLRLLLNADAIKLLTHSLDESIALAAVDGIGLVDYYVLIFEVLASLASVPGGSLRFEKRDIESIVGIS